MFNHKEGPIAQLKICETQKKKTTVKRSLVYPFVAHGLDAMCLLAIGRAFIATWVCIVCYHTGFYMRHRFGYDRFKKHTL